MKINPSTYTCFDRALVDVYRGKYCQSQTSTMGEKRKKSQIESLSQKLFCGLKNLSALVEDR